ncbi:hypothetical protein C8J57DRAFT_1234147 [Mycena rebaudengoi]|nr:hypothetical protein C8J57DRAFT_1234147 [Mycena rebaudengoi]
MPRRVVFKFAVSARVDTALLPTRARSITGRAKYATAARSPQAKPAYAATVRMAFLCVHPEHRVRGSPQATNMKTHYASPTPPLHLGDYPRHPHIVMPTARPGLKAAAWARLGTAWASRI